ncbi:hypothetical protein SEEJ0720_20495 [Salmonella enterica subsp. enterica serovar Javiana str. PRS_2010_0720]|nr:hypothetical protein SEEJ0720_20495 [Salmonella enterica subsp. enterica serovar Javiana str. PRS_2010_0720]
MKTILLSEAGRRAGLRALSKEVERVCVFDHLRDKFMNRIFGTTKKLIYRSINRRKKKNCCLCIDWALSGIREYERMVVKRQKELQDILS